MNDDAPQRTVTLAEAIGASSDAWLRVGFPGGSILRHDDNADTDKWVETGWRINVVTSELEVLCNGVFEPRDLVYEEESGILRRPALVVKPVEPHVAALTPASRPAQSSGTVEPSTPVAQGLPTSHGRASDLWKRTRSADPRDFRRWVRKRSSILLLVSWVLLAFCAGALVSTPPWHPVHLIGKWVVWLLVIPISYLLWRRSGLHAAAMMVITIMLGRSYYLYQAMGIVKPPEMSHAASAHPGESSQDGRVAAEPVHVSEAPPPPPLASQPDRPPFSRSPDGKFTVEIYDDVQQGPLILVTENGDHLFEQPSMGYLLDAHWSPNGRYLALNERRANSGDYLWIMDLQRQDVLKKPDDELWRQMQVHCSDLLQREARKSWGAEVEGDKDWGTAAHWDGSGNLIAKVTVQFYGKSIPADRSGILEARVKLRMDHQGAALQRGSAIISEPIGGKWLKEGYKAYHEKGADALTVIAYEPARFGVVRSHAALHELDLNGISIGSADAADREGGIRIDLPLRAGKLASMEYWEPSPENFSWSTPPSRVRLDEPGLHIVARGGSEARAWVALLKSLASRPAAPPAATIPSGGAPVVTPAAATPPAASPTANPFPGEKYPQTRQRLLTSAELKQWTNGAIRYAINEMFARHGATFAKEEIAGVFRAFAWYRPRAEIRFDIIEKDHFSDIERANLKELARARDLTAESGSTPATASNYRGRVGKLEARFTLIWGADGQVTGEYWHPGTNPVRKFRLAGTNTTEGSLTLQEFTRGQLTATLLLTKRADRGKVIWSGTMNNVDGRKLEVLMEKADAN
ncbi:YARHG domain-containing protein [Luteolibacter arcticus]|uniref:YARHG domain-containing protein n=1 Tax=Luteolibacter arcticus TaxID=1581411 RepID=A0ABT3GC46_9BACT|nr:YARHG domain-containing protein [Luteolibacter arcticus]MCW1921190.1 YARHG domain-containing protein [Luteolibacter arcticus]